jgi:hypothetical protein
LHEHFLWFPLLADEENGFLAKRKEESFIEMWAARANSATCGKKSESDIMTP